MESAMEALTEQYIKALNESGSSCIPNDMRSSLNATDILNTTSWRFCAPGNGTDDDRRFNASALTVITLITVVFYSIICVLGLIGNGLVICVITRYTKMQSVTNLYILNLSIVDAIFLLFLPLSIVTAVQRHWIFGTVLCKVHWLTIGINLFTGPFTLAAMSLDRYLAVVHPIASMRYRTPKYALAAISLTWVLTCLIIIPVYLWAYTVPSLEIPGKLSCGIHWPAEKMEYSVSAFVWYSLTLSFLVPLVIISVLYSLLLLRLKQTVNGRTTERRQRSRRKVTRLVTLIVATYIVCWLPYWVFNVKLTVSDIRRFEIYLYYICIILSYSNSALNPILYGFTNESFRESFINAFKCTKDPFLPNNRQLTDASACTKIPLETVVVNQAEECKTLNGQVYIGVDEEVRPEDV